jgi:hypothetical protein
VEQCKADLNKIFLNIVLLPDRFRLDTR